MSSPQRESNRLHILGSDEIQHLRLHSLHDGVSHEGAGLKNLYADELAFLIQLRCDIGAQLYAVRFFIRGNHEMQNIFLGEVRHFWFHVRTALTPHKSATPAAPGSGPAGWPLLRTPGAWRRLSFLFPGG